ncbi:hypothetical protein A9J41_11915 [Laribacter hongkongensis]|nr:hypothetical protein [Laribacter hongkongensis]
MPEMPAQFCAAFLTRLFGFIGEIALRMKEPSGSFVIFVVCMSGEHTGTDLFLLIFPILMGRSCNALKWQFPFCIKNSIGVLFRV